MKLFAIHLGNGLFLSELWKDAQIVGGDAVEIAADAAPVVLQVVSIAGAATSGNYLGAAIHAAQLVKAGIAAVAEIHEVLISSTPYTPTLDEVAAAETAINTTAAAAGVKGLPALEAGVAGVLKAVAPLIP